MSIGEKEDQLQQNLVKTWKALNIGPFGNRLSADWLRNSIPYDLDLNRTDYLWQVTLIRDGTQYCSDRHHRESNALLLAYLRLMAQQRSIQPDSEWMHFKGDVMKLVAVAKEKYPGVDVTLIGDFKAEEEPSVLIQLYRLADGTFVYFSGNMLPQCVPEGSVEHRVFYYHSGKGWARIKDNFLGLVGAEHPESYGLLRFAEVTN